MTSKNISIVAVLFLGIFVSFGSMVYAHVGGVVCIQVITTARNLATGEVKQFGTPCDVPAGWVVVSPSPVPTTPLPPITPPTSAKFQIGNTVQTITGLNVRATAKGTLLGTQANGNTGTVTEGSVSVDGFNWWKIDYVNSPDGWSIETYLSKISSAPGVGGVVCIQVITTARNLATGEVKQFGTPCDVPAGWVVVSP